MPDYEIITTEKEHNQVLTALADIDAADELNPPILDVESHPFAPEYEANDICTCILTGLALSWKHDQAVYYPLAHDDGNNFKFSYIVESIEKELLRKFEPFFNALKWCNHVSRYDWSVLRQRGTFINYCYDTYLEAYLYGKFADLFRGEQGRTEINLKSLVLRVFGFQMRHLDDFAKFPDGYHIERVSAETAAYYACDDANYTGQLHRTLYPKIKTMFLWPVEMALSPYVALMENKGIPFDASRADEQVIRLRKFIEHAKSLVYDQVERQTGERLLFNIGSPTKVADILFNKLNLPVGMVTKKTKRPATGKKALEPLAKDFDVVNNILVHRQLVRADSAALGSLPEYIHPLTKCIHSTFHQGGVPTGRFSSANPNAQNWADLKEYQLRDGDQKYNLVINIRDCVRCEPDELFWVFDNRQVEMWVAAEEAHETVLIEKIAQGIDVHTATASIVSHVPISAITIELRKRGKVQNFANIYGEGEDSMAQKLGIPVEEARAYKEAARRELPRLFAHREEVIFNARRNMYVNTHFGRFIDLEQLYMHPSKQVQAHADRFAYNGIIQGTAADISKFQLLRIAKALRNDYPVWHGITLLPTVHQGHDAWMFKTSIKIDAPSFVAKVTKAMEFPIPGYVLTPRIDVKVGQSYGFLIKYKSQSCQQIVEELISKQAQKGEAQEQQKSEAVRLNVKGVFVKDQMLALKALLAASPGINVVSVSFTVNGQSQIVKIAKYPTSLSLKDAHRFQMAVPCEVVIEDVKNVMDSIANFMQES